MVHSILRMDFEVYFIAAIIATTFFSVVPVANSVAVIFPERVTSSGSCPTEEQRTNTTQQIVNEVSSYLRVGLTESNPASSCNAIPSYRPSGEYWILPATGPPAVQVYCDFNRQCGCDGPSTWTRVAFLNMSDPSHNCPSSWFTYTSPVRACGRGVLGTESCVSETFSTYGKSYSRVCGRMMGYQNYFTSAFAGLVGFSRSLDQSYLDGVSLTHGSRGAREHIWSFASAAVNEVALNSAILCDCSSTARWPHSTSFVGNDYFCDSGNLRGVPVRNQVYSDDPLWDGAGCGSTSTCCEFNNPPWFCKTLSQPTTDDLEVRVCYVGGTGRDVLVELIELYVQ